MSSQVFTDATGKRWGWARRILAALAFVAAASVTGFVISLLIIPFVPSLQTARLVRPSAKVALPTLDRKARLSRYLLRQARLKLWRAVASAEARRKRPARTAVSRRGVSASPRIVAAFYTTWQKAGLHSLRANADKLTHLMPEWLHLDASGAGLDLSDWNPDSVPHNRTVVELARQHAIELHPILNNAAGAGFDPQRVHTLLSSPGAQQTLATRLRDWLTSNGFQGLNVDLENLQRGDYARLTRFLQLLRRTLQPAGLALSVDLEIGALDHAAAISRSVDFVVLMAYDEHDVDGEPGPIASAGWANDVLERALLQIPAAKLVLGIGSYAYDWGGGRSATVLDNLAALLLARDALEGSSLHDLAPFDQDALNPTFRYSDEDDKEHQVWLLDAATAYNQLLLAQRRGVRGSALWAMGAEDPGVWQLMDRARAALPAASVLSRVSHPAHVVFQGAGEILTVVSTPAEGARRVTVDPRTGLCTAEVWQTLPTPYVIRRSGHLPQAVALTFDDGPSGQWTAHVLDLLRAQGVRATFFLIGSNAERHPELVRRQWAEGHEIGNHTFSHPNLGLAGRGRTRLELNAAQRALQSIIGRSTLLFRPPYNADAEPTSAEEVAPLVAAAELGYLTIGELVDPQDWNLWKAGPGGEQVPRSAQEMVDSALAELHAGKGNVVLLHDGGGDRSRTLEVLRQLIPRLRAAGFRFVTTSQLLRKTRDDVMPRLSAQDQLLAGVDRIVFETVYTLESFLGVAFTVAIILGVGRVLLLLPLALIQRRRRRAAPDTTHRPRVSVLIAAYNERLVIGRTLQTVLASSYPDLEVIVIDDGSTDGTADEVERGWGADARVRLIRQANTGKAGALNHAMREARGEILACFDADTQVRPDCIALLVAPFADPRIAAVAGNVKVGNAINALTRLQSIEYITSQNLDREAYALLNAVTVVPGAVGAWRRGAVLEAGGYLADTLAEDMDLTWRLRRAGHRVWTEHRAIGMTEAPDTVRAFFKQRFRWTHGTLQCLWKHRGALFRHGWFGGLALPSQWLFGVLFQIIAPLVDLQLLVLLGQFASSWITRGVYQGDWQPFGGALVDLQQAAFFYGLFFVVDLIGAWVAFRLDGERPHGLWRLFWQRLIYRQVMYAVLWKSLVTALRGLRQGWGKLDRKGTVGE